MNVLRAFLISLFVFVAVAPSWAAITYVGAQSAGVAGTTSAVTVNFALTGGSDAAPIAGDLVVVTWCANIGGDVTMRIMNTGAVDYTLIGAEQFANDVFDTQHRVAYRVMPDPVETQVTLTETVTGGTANVANGGAYNITVFRGVHATPLEQAAQQGTGTNTSLVNPGSITPTTAGTFIYVSGCGSLGTGGAYTQADLTDFRAATIADTNDENIGSGYLEWASGEYVPATFGGGGSDSADNSYAWTIVAFAPAAEVAANVVPLNRGALFILGIP